MNSLALRPRVVRTSAVFVLLCACAPKSGGAASELTAAVRDRANWRSAPRRRAEESAPRNAVRLPQNGGSDSAPPMPPRPTR